MMNKSSFLGVASRTSSRSLINLSLFVIAGRDIDLNYCELLLNGLPWKQTDIIMSFSRLHPSTVFQILLLILKDTLLLWDSCRSK